MIEGVGDSLPTIISTTIAMIVLSGVTLYVSNRLGFGQLSSAVSRESDRLVATQDKRIKLLETRVLELEKELAESLKREEEYIRRIDALEKLITDEQLRKLLLRG